MRCKITNTLSYHPTQSLLTTVNRLASTACALKALIYLQVYADLICETLTGLIIVFYPSATEPRVTVDNPAYGLLAPSSDTPTTTQQQQLYTSSITSGTPSQPGDSSHKANDYEVVGAAVDSQKESKREPTEEEEVREEGKNKGKEARLEGNKELAGETSEGNINYAAHT